MSANVVGQAGDCEARDPATGEVLLRAGIEIQVPLVIDPDFSGPSIEVRATDPRTGAILARLGLQNGRLDWAMPDLDPLDLFLPTTYAGKVVRKDLLHQIKGGDNVPSYVLEYLLGRYCASDDPDEIRLGVEAVKNVISSNYFRHDEANKAQSLVEQRGRHRFIDRVEVRFVPSENKYWAAMDNFSFNRIHVNERFYRQYERLLEGGIWAQIDLEFHAAEDDDQQRGRSSPFHVAEMRPIQLARFDLDEFSAGRGQLSTEQWLDVLLRSAGLEPSGMSHRLKLLLVARFLPFVEKNYNLIELGPRGTGKSYAYSQFSPYCILVSGGKASSANLFYNNARRQVGLVRVLGRGRLRRGGRDEGDRP